MTGYGRPSLAARGRAGCRMVGGGHGGPPLRGPKGRGRPGWCQVPLFRVRRGGRPWPPGVIPGVASVAGGHGGPPLRGPKGRGSPVVERPQALGASHATPGLLRWVPSAGSPRNDGVGAAVWRRLHHAAATLFRMGARRAAEVFSWQGFRLFRHGGVWPLSPRFAGCATRSASVLRAFDSSRHA